LIIVKTKALKLENDFLLKSLIKLKSNSSLVHYSAIFVKK